MEEIIEHFCHEHPFIFTENVVEANLRCYVCKKPVISESAYICVERCGSESMILHKRCGELPKQILHPSHSEHPLHLFHFEADHTCGTGFIPVVHYCDICRKTLENCIGYRCCGCDFDIDISCLILDEKSMIKHPSHHHVLTLTRKPACLFYCDGCGSEDRDMAYACSTCELMIHKKCASLPLTLPTSHHHHHQLSLAFNFPIKHRRFTYACDICRQDFHAAYWVYYCGDCRFFAHVKCATSNTTLPDSSSSTNITGGRDLIQLPVHDIAKELIAPFIIRENSELPTNVDAMPSLIMPLPAATSSIRAINYHNHPLSLVREEDCSVVDDQEVKKICDVCVSPIYSPPYYNSTTNTYFLHSTCYFLPETLSRPVSDDLYGTCVPARENHIFTRCTSLGTTLNLHSKCHLCKLKTNGMVYKCEGGCGKCIDVKCASLPTMLQHSSHPHHEQLVLMRSLKGSTICGATDCATRFIDLGDIAYFCNNFHCDFALHLGCALLPPSVEDKRWDKKHSLVLTYKYNASLDHPTDFYCESCEQEMHPKSWMYHCRECDNSFHPRCLTASGKYRNIKFGHQLEADHRLHPHPLTYNIVTLRLRCNICNKECFNKPGVECELCNYAACRHCALEICNV